MGEPIQVKITDDTGTATISTSSLNQQTNKPIAPNQQAKANQKAVATTALAVMTVRRSVNYLTSNIGKWTGNSQNQSFINNAKQVVGYGIAFAANPILGALSMGFDAVTTAIDTSYEQYWNNYKSEQARVRNGGKGGYRR